MFYLKSVLVKLICIINITILESLLTATSLNNKLVRLSIDKLKENPLLTQCSWRDISVVEDYYCVLDVFIAWVFSLILIQTFPTKTHSLCGVSKLAPGRLIRDKYNSNCGRRPRYKQSHTLYTLQSTRVEIEISLLMSPNSRGRQILMCHLVPIV